MNLRQYALSIRLALWISVVLVLVGCSNAADDLGAAESSPSIQARQCADAKAVILPRTGDYGRPIATDSEQAQDFFDQGLRLTYSYYFPEALASFEAGLCFDPDNPMLQWGRALAIAPNPNSRYGSGPDDPAGKGEKAIARAQANAAGLPAVDRALIDTLAVLYERDQYPERDARSEAFIEATQALIEEYPRDLEAAFLAADAIMMASPWQYFSTGDGRPIGMAGSALRVLESGMAQNPRHPGLTHLHIHLLENSKQPERAETSADRLESLTPMAGHMVHMPGHIYMRLGRYDDAIATNERSLAADQYVIERWGDRPLPSGLTYGLSARVHGGHARNFIQWGSLMQGNSTRAIAEAKAMADAVSEEALNRGSSLRTPAIYLMSLRAFGRWDDIVGLPIPPASQPYLAGILHGFRGSAYLARDDVTAAQEELSKLLKAAQSEQVQTQRASVNRATDLLNIAEHVLRGEIASARGQDEEAIQYFQAAVDVQDQLRYMEPPDWLHSSRLYLGQAYLDAGQPERAEKVFREDLDLLRGNGWALFGLTKSLEAQGQSEAAGEVWQRFEEAWAKADVELTAAHY